MKELQAIWDDMAVEEVSMERVDSVIKRKSAYELLKFGKLVKIELYASLGVFVVILLFSGSLEPLVTIITASAAITGIPLGLFALKQLKKIELSSNLKLYLESAIRFLRFYLLCFAMSIQLVLLLTLYVMLYAEFESLTLTDIIHMEQRQTVLFVIVFIEMFMFIYARTFYVSRIRNMRDLLDELNS